MPERIVRHNGIDYLARFTGQFGLWNLHSLADDEIVFTLHTSYFEFQPQMNWEKLHDDAQLPTYSGPDVAGFDFYAVESFTIPARSKVNARTGLKGAIPPGHWVQINPRSGTSWKNCVETGAGVIDWGYGGEWGIVLYNHSDEPYHVIKGDRIAQGVMMEYKRAEHKWGNVERDRGGLGSTGR